jgi:transketolase C-terminal domain/subunit
VLCVVEGKNESIAGGLGQCVAEVVAAQRFNLQEGNGIETVHGLVTTGSNWKFLRLHGSVVTVDINEHQLSQVERILGILLHAVGPLPQPASAA